MNSLAKPRLPLGFSSLDFRISALLLILAAPVLADEVLDQSFDPGTPANGIDAVVDDLTHHAQTFTIGIDGTLAKLTYYLTRSDGADTERFNYCIMRTDPAGLPDDTQILRSGSLPGTVIRTGAPGSQTFNFGVTGFNIPVSQGDVLAIAVSREVPADFIWHGESADPYPSGGAFVKDTNGNNQWTAIPDTDLGFRIFVEPPPEPANVVLYPTEAAVKIRDLAAGTSHSVNYDGGGPGTPLTRDVDLTISPDGAFAVFPAPDGLEVIDLNDRSADRSTWLSSGASIALTPGVDAAILPDSSFAIYPTPTHFELASLLSGNRRASQYSNPAPAALTADVDLVLTQNGSHAVLPFDQGFQVLDTATNSTRFVAFDGPAGRHPIPVAVDVLFTLGGLGLYPREDGWEILDPVARTSIFAEFAGRKPLLPLPIDVDAFYSAALDRACYPSRDGLEILEVGTGTTLLAPWAGPGPPALLTRSVDAPLTPDGLRCIFPTVQGFEVIDLATATSTFVPYGGNGPAFESPGGMQQGVDVLVSANSQGAVYPTPEGLEVLDLTTPTSTLIPWAGGNLGSSLPRGVDAVLSSDGAIAIYVRASGWEAVPLPGGPATLVPFFGAGPGPDLPLDVDPIFHEDNQRVFYTTPQGFEQLDLSGAPIATLIAFSGGAPGATLPTGIDPLVQPHHAGGPPTLNMAFANDDPGDEDYVFDANNGDPAEETPRSFEWNPLVFTGQGWTGDFPAEVQAFLDSLAPAGLTWIAAEAGTVRFNPPNDDPGEVNVEVKDDQRGLQGTPLEGRHHFQFWGVKVPGDGRTVEAIVRVIVDTFVPAVTRMQWTNGTSDDKPLPQYQLDDIDAKAGGGNWHLEFETDEFPDPDSDGPTLVPEAGTPYLVDPATGKTILGMKPNEATDPYYVLSARTNPNGPRVWASYFQPTNGVMQRVDTYAFGPDGTKFLVGDDALNLVDRVGDGAATTFQFDIQNNSSDPDPLDFHSSMAHELLHAIGFLGDSDGTLALGGSARLDVTVEATQEQVSPYDLFLGSSPGRNDLGHASGTAAGMSRKLELVPIGGATYASADDSAIITRGLTIPVEGEDCDLNGIPDLDEIAAEPLLDIDDNGILDLCEQAVGRIMFFNRTDLALAAVDPAGGSITIDAADLTDGAGPFRLNAEQIRGITLFPGEGASVDYEFAPGNDGSFSDTMEVITDGVGSGSVINQELRGGTIFDECVDVSGSAGITILSPRLIDVDFGIVRIGTTERKNLVLQNAHHPAGPQRDEFFRFSTSVSRFAFRSPFRFMVDPADEPREETEIFGGDGPVDFELAFTPTEVGPARELLSYNLIVRSGRLEDGEAKTFAWEWVILTLGGVGARGIEFQPTHQVFEEDGRFKYRIGFPVQTGNRYRIEIAIDGENFSTIKEFVATQDEADKGEVFDILASVADAIFRVTCFDGPNLPFFVEEIRFNDGILVNLVPVPDFLETSRLIFDPARQRSVLCRISVQFNREANIPELLANGQIHDAVRLELTRDDSIFFVSTTISYDDATRTMTIVPVDGALRGGREKDAYRLLLDRALICATTDDVKLQDFDGDPSGFVRRPFDLLRGDFNGDGRRTRLDILAAPIAGELPAEFDLKFRDLNNDGVINALDVPEPTHDPDYQNRGFSIDGGG